MSESRNGPNDGPNAWKNIVIAALLGALGGTLGSHGLFQYTSPWNQDRLAVLSKIESSEKAILKLEKSLENISDALNDSNRELAEIKGLLRARQ